MAVRGRAFCDSTFLIDRRTHISPKLQELEGIIDEMVVQNGRKMVIFSEWTTMTYLIGRYLSEVEIGFVELSGKKAPSADRRIHHQLKVPGNSVDRRRWHGAQPALGAAPIITNKLEVSAH